MTSINLQNIVHVYLSSSLLKLRVCVCVCVRVCMEKKRVTTSIRVIIKTEKETLIII